MHSCGQTGIQSAIPSQISVTIVYDMAATHPISPFGDPPNCSPVYLEELVKPIIGAVKAVARLLCCFKAL